MKRGDTMEWVNFKVKEGEREKLKNDAHAHRMNISEYLRWLIDKQRKEDEKKMKRMDNNTCCGCIYENIDDTTEDISKCVCCKRNFEYAKNDYYTRKEDEGK